MYDFLWLHLQWHPIWMIIGVVAAFVVMRFALASGLLLLALVIYNGFLWNPWFVWLPDVFWLAFVASMVGIVWGLVTGGGRVLALWGAAGALIVSALLANSDVLGASPPLDREVPGITGQINQVNSRVDSEEGQRIEEDARLREELNILRQRSHLHPILRQKVADLEARLCRLEGQGGGK